MKARLWKGPFSGKLVDINGQPMTIRMTGPKKMTRKQRYEWEREMYGNGPGPLFSSTIPPSMRYPQIYATYRMVIKRGYGGNEPHTHPDGSIFYEFVSKSERP